MCRSSIRNGHTFVSASGSTNRCLPRDLTNVRDLCASTAILRSDEVLPAFFLEGLTAAFSSFVFVSYFDIASSGFWVKSNFFSPLVVAEKHRAG